MNTIWRYLKPLSINWNYKDSSVDWIYPEIIKAYSQIPQGVSVGTTFKPVHVDWLVDGVDFTREFPVTKILSAPGEINQYDLAYAYDEAIRFAFDLEDKGIKNVYVGWSL